MKATFNTQEALTQIRNVARIAPKGENIVESMRAVHLLVEKGDIRMSVTGASARAFALVSASTVEQPGGCGVSADQLARVLAACPGETTTIDVNGNFLELASDELFGRLSITESCYPVELDYPDGAWIDGLQLKNEVGPVLSAVQPDASDKYSPERAGVSLTGTRAIAVGHHWARSRPTTAQSDHVVPPSLFSMIGNDPCEVLFDGPKGYIRSKRFGLEQQLMFGKIPDWSALEGDRPAVYSFDRVEMIQFLTRLMAVSPEANKVLLGGKGRLYGRAGSIALSMDITGEAPSHGINGKLLLGALRNMSHDRVEVRHEERRPFGFYGSSTDVDLIAPMATDGWTWESEEAKAKRVAA